MFGIFRSRYSGSSLDLSRSQGMNLRGRNVRVEMLKVTTLISNMNSENGTERVESLILVSRE
jgi:hypothetical protein